MLSPAARLLRDDVKSGSPGLEHGSWTMLDIKYPRGVRRVDGDVDPIVHVLHNALALVVVVRQDNRDRKTTLYGAVH